MIVICFLSFVHCRVFNYLGRIIVFLRFGCGYFFVLLFHCCVIVFPYSLWPMVVIPRLSFLNFPVCDFSRREKLVVCSLAADVFVFHCFVIVFPCSLWPVVVYHFSIFLCVICR